MSSYSVKMCKDDGWDYKLYEHRIKSFDTWNYESIVEKTKLAENGFFYVGLSDQVQCAFCHVVIGKWEKHDIVEDEHRKWSDGKCPMVKQREKCIIDNSQDLKCKICKKNLIDLLLIPCYHINLCYDCKNIEYCP